MALYDAFISYSHAKDKPTAGALQSAIQKLGKPWYRRRALRVFRDDTSLSATPHLWPTIEQALEESRFLILLASPEAAASHWVGKEVAYWLERKSADTLLIAVTDGMLAWDNAVTDFAWGKGAPLPLALEGRFAAEPKWVDLTAYRDSANKRDAKFTELAADFAAAIRGIPKEDLLSQEVKQQRHALTLAWSAAGSLLILAGLAGWQWKTAVEAKQLANRQTQIAQTERDHAISAERTATTQKEIAQNQRDRAERTLAAAIDTANVLVSDLAREFRDFVGVRTELVKKILDRAAALQKRLTESGESNEQLKNSTASALIAMSQTLRTLGNSQASLETATRAEKIYMQLAAEHQNNPRYPGELGLAGYVVGDALMSIGQTEAALQKYEQALLLVRNSQSAYGEGKGVWLTNFTLGYEHVGDALAALDKNFEASQAYKSALDMMTEIAILNSRNLPFQERYVGLILRMSDVLVKYGNRDLAIQGYQMADEVAKRVVGENPDNKGWLERSAYIGEKTADLFTDVGRWSEAGLAYESGLNSMQRIASIDPKDTEVQERIAMLYAKLSDVQIVNGEIQHGLASIEQFVTIRESLAAADPTNAAKQYNFANALHLAGEQFVRQGQKTHALEHLQRSLQLYRKLSEAHPDDLNARRAALAVQDAIYWAH